MPIHIDFLIAKGTQKVGHPPKMVKLWTELTEKISDRHVLLIEDIVDSGLTADFLVSNLRKHGPLSVELCTLLDKPANRKIHFHPRYVGFEVPSAYVVGYGLDFNQEYRNLPYLATMGFDGVPMES